MKRYLLALMAAGLMTVTLATDTAEARGRVVIRGGNVGFRGAYRGGRVYSRGYIGSPRYRGGYYRAPRYYNYGGYGYGYGNPGYYGGYGGYGYPYGGRGIYFRF